MRLSLLILLISSTILSHSLRITTIPGYVDVYVNGKLVGNTGEDGELVLEEAGDVMMEFEKPGYWPVVRHISVEDSTNIEVFLDILTYGRIVTDPPGAELFVDGLRLGESPYTGHLPSGEHVIRAVRDDYGEVEKEVVFEEHEWNFLSLKLVRYGTVEIDSDVESWVFSDGVYLGLTPASVVLDPGTHTIMAWDGERLLVREIHLGKNDIERIGFEFESNPKVRFASIPEGGWISIDGKVFKLPVDVRLPKGKHRIRVEYPGFEPHEETVEIEGWDVFYFVLNPIDYRLSLKTDIEASVFVNGEYIGRTPLEVKMEPGLKRMILKSEGGEWLYVIVLSGDTELNLRLRGLGTVVLKDESYEIDGIRFEPGDVVHIPEGFHSFKAEGGEEGSFRIRAGEILFLGSRR